MIVYLDTSSLVKVYLADEPGGDEVRQSLAPALWIATSDVSYPEARSAFARRRRERRLSKALFRTIVTELDADWAHYSVVPVTGDLCRRAGELAEAHGLRALDAIHVASFLQLAEANRDAPIEFSSFDTRLTRAVRAAVRAMNR